MEMMVKVLFVGNDIDNHYLLRELSSSDLGINCKSGLELKDDMGLIQCPL